MKINFLIIIKVILISSCSVDTVKEVIQVDYKIQTNTGNYTSLLNYLELKKAKLPPEGSGNNYHTGRYKQRSLYDEKITIDANFAQNKVSIWHFESRVKTSKFKEAESHVESYLKENMIKYEKVEGFRTIDNLYL